MEGKDHILNKIKKLLALTEERGATPDEAATAAAKVQALLDEYNLSLEDVPTDDPTVNEVVSVDERLAQKARSPYAKVLAGLLHVIAITNWCRSIYFQSIGGARLYGTKANVQVVRYLYAYLARALMQEAKRTVPPGENAVSWTVSFIEGARHEIYARLRARRAEQRATGDRTNALVVVNDLRVDERVRADFPRTGKATAPRSHAMGRLAGAAFAHNLPLHDGVAGRTGGGQAALT